MPIPINPAALKPGKCLAWMAVCFQAPDGLLSVISITPTRRLTGWRGSHVVLTCSRDTSLMSMLQQIHFNLMDICSFPMHDPTLRFLYNPVVCGLRKCIICTLHAYYWELLQSHSMDNYPTLETKAAITEYRSQTCIFPTMTSPVVMSFLLAWHLLSLHKICVELIWLSKTTHVKEYVYCCP